MSETTDSAGVDPPSSNETGTAAAEIPSPAHATAAPSSSHKRGHEDGDGKEAADNQQQQQTPSKKARPSSSLPSSTKGLPTRQYLDQTVVPILLEALAALAKERPLDPIDYLVAYLQKHKHEHSGGDGGPSAGEGYE